MPEVNSRINATMSLISLKKARPSERPLRTKTSSTLAIEINLMTLQKCNVFYVATISGLLISKSGMYPVSNSNDGMIVM